LAAHARGALRWPRRGPEAMMLGAYGGLVCVVGIGVLCLTPVSDLKRKSPLTASAFLVEQRYGVGDAGDDPAQAGEHQQFFDLPDHDSPPAEKVPETPTTRSGNLGSTRAGWIPIKSGDSRNGRGGSPILSD
jgi:hypothetical protein